MPNRTDRWFMVATLLIAVAAYGQADAPDVASLRQARAELDATVWADERLAQEYEHAFVALWDDLRGSSDPIATLAAFPFDTITIADAGDFRARMLGIREAVLEANPRPIDHVAWQAWLQSWRERGFSLVQTEWHLSLIHI